MHHLNKSFFYILKDSLIFQYNFFKITMIKNKDTFKNIFIHLNKKIWIIPFQVFAHLCILTNEMHLKADA